MTRAMTLTRKTRTGLEAPMKQALPLLMIGLALAGPADAQTGRTSRTGLPPASRASRPAPRGRAAPPPPPLVSLSEIVGVGVVEGIDRRAGRVSLAYDAIEGLNWPAGRMPFVLSKTALLDGVAVGDKVWFRLDSQQIVDLRPFGPAKSQATAAPPPDPAWAVRPDAPR